MNIMISKPYLTSLLLAVCWFILGFTPAISKDLTSFRQQIAPLLLENCLACHGPKRAEGGYRVDSFESLQKAGDSGLPPLGTPDLEANELLRRLNTSDHSERMPAESEPLSLDQIGIVRKWISEGAAFDGEKHSDPLFKVIPPVNYPPPAVSYALPVPITSMVFSPDGSQLITGGHYELLVWNVADGSVVRRITNLDERTYALAWNSTGTHLAAGGGSPGKLGEVRWIDYASGQVQATFARSYDVVLDLAVRPNKNELAVASADSTIRLFDLTTMSERKLIASHADWVTSVSWSDDGTKLASASRDKTAKICDAESGDLIASYPGHAAAVRGISILPESKQVVSVGADGKLQRWDIEGAKKVAEVGIGLDGFRIVQGPGFVLVPSADKALHRIDLSNNSNAQVMKGHSEWVLSCAHHAGSMRYASGSLNGEVKIWNATDGALVHAWVAKP
jgi:WD40 repeat protein